MTVPGGGGDVESGTTQTAGSRMRSESRYPLLETRNLTMNCTRLLFPTLALCLLGFVAASCGGTDGSNLPRQASPEPTSSSGEARHALHRTGSRNLTGRETSRAGRSAGKRVRSHRPRHCRSFLDRILRSRLARNGVTALSEPGAFDPDVVELGRNLFFDKELSANRDMACATCHHPKAMTGDGLHLSVGMGGTGRIPNRRVGPGRQFVPRNAPDLFNRGLPQWRRLLWDGRVEETKSGHLSTPAGAKLQSGLDGPLAALAMFPVTDRVEMRGSLRDPTPLSKIPGEDFNAIWSKLMDRLMSIPEYREMFRDAFPGQELADLQFADAANALAAFQLAAFTFLDSPFDRYLRGDNKALTRREKRGAMLFYGKAGCGDCHSGSLTTDQKHHNIGAPQIGPGKPPFAPLDPGRFRIEDKRRLKYAFRTPPLRNVEVTAPYLHDGAYTSLRAVVEHHLEPAKSLRNYDASALRPDVRRHVHDSPSTIRDVLRTLDWRMRIREIVQRRGWYSIAVTDTEIDLIIAFLKSMTSPSIQNLDDHVTPDSVPSGLPVDR